MSNALADSTSPYLLQHADNPVDWREWGDEAFAEARRRDVPVLLSVGYAACHWCHVMAHESFEDPATAEMMNAGFVCVKVDREERPDVDAAYMGATTALTGQGGWPMTVFLRPDGAPFHAGTYHPPVPLAGRPSFQQVMAAVTQAWTQRRGQVDGAATSIAGALASRSAAGAGADHAPLTAERLDEAVTALADQEDRVNGGFGGAPKFPPSPALGFLLRHAGAGAASSSTRGLAGGIAGRTLVAMARSGTYDQVVGGFARYAVDAGWVVPHFEKMLYDNAQLARAYLHWWRLDPGGSGARVALETCDWMLDALVTPEGALASSLDADTPVPGSAGHGVEGATYVWTPRQLTQVLGEADGTWAAGLLGVTEEGSFEAGASTAVLTRDVWSAADGEAHRWTAVRERLRAARAARPQPARDDKVVAGWNGLAVAALAECGALLDRPDLVGAARRAAELLCRLHAQPDGSWRRTSRDGLVGSAPAVLEDLGGMAEGFLALHAVTGEHRWLESAEQVLDQVLTRFAAGGVLHDTAGDAGDPRLALMGRPADPSDGASPSGTSLAAGALTTFAALTGSTAHRLAAERALAPASALAAAAPRFAGWGLAVAQALVEGPVSVTLRGPAGPGLDALRTAALAGASPGLALGPEPVADDRPAGGGVDREVADAVVCRAMACSPPTTSPEELARAVGARARP